MTQSADVVVTWLHSSSGRSKRKEIVTAGCFVLEHEATGRFYLGQSETVSKDVDKQLSQLALGKHPNKLLNALYAKDMDIRVYEYPLTAKKKRAALLKATLEGASAPYLCLNPRDAK
ncbi:hypothetical protein D3C78_428010 [compost metagenome]